MTSVRLELLDLLGCNRGLRSGTFGDGDLVAEIRQRAVEVSQSALLVQDAAFTGLLDLDLAVVRQAEGRIPGLLVELARQGLHRVPGGLFAVLDLGLDLDTPEVRVQDVRTSVCRPSPAAR